MLPLSITSKNLTRYALFMFTIVPLILIGMIVFHQRHIHIFQYKPVLHVMIRSDKNSVRIYQPLSLSILRGIIVFYPHDQKAEFLPELLWLYRSWIEMMKDEPSLWRTDLVIFSGAFSLNLRQLGCVYNRIRIDRQERPRCRVFYYKRINLRNIQNILNTSNNFYSQSDRSRLLLLTTHFQAYPYIDSINIISECYRSYAMYDYILRTDIDVFLTKYFGRFVPVNDTLLVGRGGYSTPFNVARLRRISKDMNWSYGNMTNIGSTWYGPPHVAQRIANLSIEAMLYVSLHEFTEPERQGQVGTLLWPDWHYGVLLLYGCELAMNHLVSNEGIHIDVAYDILDQFTTDKNPYGLEENNRLHLHCWHTDEQFSKFDFKAGKYNHINSDTFLNDTSASAFAMRMALESRLMSFGKLRQALVDAKNSSRS